MLGGDAELHTRDGYAPRNSSTAMRSRIGPKKLLKNQRGCLKL